jgi:hypothetical protein
MIMKRMANQFAALTALLAASTLIAGSTYDLSWYTIDGGGGTSTGGSFVVRGTIGQPDAGVMSGGNFELRGGFWAGGGPSLLCLGDVVGSDFTPPADGVVDGFDLAVLLGEWGANPGSFADLVGNDFTPPPDGNVDGFDLAVLLGAWGNCQ